MSSAHELDLGPLTWVKGEIDLALERAAGALAEAETASDRLGRIKFAQTHLHQAHGALSIVGLDGLTQFSEALDRLLGELAAEQVTYTPAIARLATRGLAALGNYLNELTRGQPDQPLRLFELYAQLVEARGHEAPGPSDLFYPDLSLRPAFAPLPEGGTDDARTLRALRGRFERGLLKWLRNPGDASGPAEMRDAVNGIERTQRQPASRAFWLASAAFFDALGQQAIDVDPPLKRLCGRIDAQMRRLLEGSAVVAERLMRDVLYQVAIARCNTPPVNALREAYRLVNLIPAPGRSVSDAPVAPLLVALHSGLGDAREAWTLFTGGGAIGLPRFQDALAPLPATARAIGQPHTAALIEGLGRLAQWLRQDPLRLTDTLSMDMATAMLLVEGLVDSHEMPSPGPRLKKQIAAVTERIQAYLRGEQPAPLSIADPDTADQQLGRQLAHEILANLGDVEQHLDGFFREPARTDLLAATSAPLKQVEGALAIMNQGAAVRLVQDCAAAISALESGRQSPEAAIFEDIAHRLSALGVFIDALQHGPADLEQILNPSTGDSAGDSLEAELVQQKRETAALAAALQENPDDIGLRTELLLNLEGLRQDASLTADAELEKQAREALNLLDAGAPFAAPPAIVPEAMAPALSPEAARLLDASDAEIDAELLDIFIEEASTVRDTIASHLDLLIAAPGDQEHLTTIRRSFHTLKGSGRMVGLKDFGEAAWGMEQTLNHWLRLERPATPELLALIRRAHVAVSDWVDQLQAGGGLSLDVADILREAERLRGEEDHGAALEIVQNLESSILQPIIELDAPPPAPAVEFPALDFDSLEASGERPSTDRLDIVLDDAPAEPPVALEELIWAEPPAVPAPPAPTAAEPAPSELATDAIEIEIEIEAAALEDDDVFPEEGAEVIDLGAPESLEPDASEAVDLPESDATAEAIELGAAAQESVADTPSHGREHDTEDIDSLEDDDAVRLGHVVLSRPLFDLYLAEARQHLATLRHELGRMAVNPSLLPANAAIRAAHTLSGISGTAQFTAPQSLAKALELAQQRLADHHQAPSADQAQLLNGAATALETMLAQLSGRRLPDAQPELVDALDNVLRGHLAEVITLRPEIPSDLPPPELATAPLARSPEPVTPPPEAPSAAAPVLRDELDAELLPIFLDEGNELLHSLDTALRAWRAQPDDATQPAAVARLLHTLKGSARMVGAMSFGASIHELETRLERARRLAPDDIAIVDDIESALDRSRQTLETLGISPPATTPAAVAAAPIDVETGAVEAVPAGADGTLAAPRAQLRVEATRVDQFVNEAGEISIARTRIEGELRTLRRSLLDLTENVIRLRNQLREVEIQADTQMQSRLSQVETRHTEFDPLEMDRYTRLQELTRMMAESVGDVTTVQQNLLRNLDGAESALHAQSRMTRDLQQSLMHVRMVPFDSLAERLYRLVRQTAKDVGRRANLDIIGGQIEIDRGVLEAMTGPLDHLVRNAVAHGIELPDARRAAGKAEIGQITLRITHEGNEVVIEFRDDGAGLDFDAIRAHAIATGLLGTDEESDDKRLANLIFLPGFSTATLSSVAGRGVGMDVVKSETAAVGGRLSVETDRGRGTTFRIHLPLTLAVTQALLVRSGGRTWAIPSSMVAQVLELKAAALEKVRAEHGTDWLGERFAYRYLPRLLGDSATQPQVERFNWVLLLRAGSETLALHVDALRGNQEVVVKNAGPQYARMVGFSGATVLGDGEIVLILNPVALAARAPDATDDGVPGLPAAPAIPEVPLVMVVDDSLTVRKITGRLLEREGYRVLTAKDGVDALEQLGRNDPDVIIADIEMPRMDGFDLTRNIRADARHKRVPIIMITSRMAEKHQRYAEEIGVNHYLGKPYDEDLLLRLIRRYTRA